MCAFCTCRIAQFPPDANLIQRHLQAYPECNFLLYPHRCGNVPIHPETGEDVPTDTIEARRLNLLTRRLISDSREGSKCKLFLMRGEKRQGEKISSFISSCFLFFIRQPSRTTTEEVRNARTKIRVALSPVRNPGG